MLSEFNGEAVLDKETQLVWERSARGVATWGQALFTCIDTNVGDRKGWRLPSVNELASLIVPSATVPPKLPPGHPFLNVGGAAFYWSATTNAENPAGAWVVNFNGGNVVTNDKPAFNQVWCVRGGMQADTY